MKTRYIFAVAALLLAMFVANGCSGGGDSNTSTGSEAKNIVLYNNPMDSRVVSFEKDGKQLLFSGVKDSSGVAERIDSLHLVDGDKEYTVYYNEFGLPSKSVNHANGSMTKFEYTSQQLSFSRNTGAFDRVLNGIKAEITKINGTASETTVRIATIPSIEVSTIGPSTEIVEGNVVINVDYCGEPAFPGINVRVNYSGGFVNLWTEAKIQPSVAGQFIATIPEHYDPNLPNTPVPITNTDMCNFSDKVLSSLCKVPSLVGTTAILCAQAGVTVPACTTALTAYQIYCLTAPDGTPPGTVMGETVCNTLGKILDQLPDTDTMSVQAYVCPKGVRSCKTDYLAKSDLQTINSYGRHNLHFYLNVIEPSFEGFTFNPSFPRMTDGYEVTANYSCIEDRTLVLEVENELGISFSQKQSSMMSDSISKYIFGRNFTDDQTYAKDYITALAKDEFQAVELQNTAQLRWDKPVECPDGEVIENGECVVEPNSGQSCPATVTYTGKTYNTIQIGDQCWLKENLDAGTMIPGYMAMSDNSFYNILEKYCYDDDVANCNTYGGLYQWDEVMQYSTTEGAQGICPGGWHIPTIAEFRTLVDSFDNSSNALKAIGQGAKEGTGTNTSSFSALLAGYRYISHDSLTPDQAFWHLGWDTYFASSTNHDSNSFESMGLTKWYDYIDFWHGGKKDGVSVRCLKNN